MGEGGVIESYIHTSLPKAIGYTPSQGYIRQTLLSYIDANGETTYCKRRGYISVCTLRCLFVEEVFYANPVNMSDFLPMYNLDIL